jgi:hypothetical protein
MYSLLDKLPVEPTYKQVACLALMLILIKDWNFKIMLLTSAPAASN